MWGRVADIQVAAVWHLKKKHIVDFMRPSERGPVICRQTTAICQQTRRRRNSLDENNSHLLLFMTIKIARTVIVFYKSWRRCQLCLCSASSAVRKVLRMCHCVIVLEADGALR